MHRPSMMCVQLSSYNPPNTPSIILSHVLHQVHTPCMNRNYLVVQILMPFSKMKKYHPLKQVILQASNHIHLDIMNYVSQAVKGNLVPQGIMPSQHPIEVKQPLSKPYWMCDSIMNHLSYENPYQTIKGLNIHNVPQIT